MDLVALSREGFGQVADLDRVPAEVVRREERRDHEELQGLHQTPSRGMRYARRVRKALRPIKNPVVTVAILKMPTLESYLPMKVRDRRGAADARSAWGGIPIQTSRSSRIARIRPRSTVNTPRRRCDRLLRKNAWTSEPTGSSRSRVIDSGFRYGRRDVA